jgi:hypothetical protein
MDPHDLRVVLGLLHPFVILTLYQLPVVLISKHNPFVEAILVLRLPMLHCGWVNAGSAGRTVDLAVLSVELQKVFLTVPGFAVR